MDVVQVGIAAGGEGAQQVHRARRLHVGEFHPRRVGDARLRREVRAVDDVPAIGGQRDAVLRLAVRGARLGELPCHAAKLHDRHLAAEGQHHGHLQQHAEGVADDVGGEVAETFRAVAALQNEGFAVARARERRPEAPGLACKNQRGKSRDLPFHGGKRRLVRVVRHLPDRHRPPGIGAPASRGHCLALSSVKVGHLTLAAGDGGSAAAVRGWRGRHATEGMREWTGAMPSRS